MFVVSAGPVIMVRICNTSPARMMMDGISIYLWSVWKLHRKYLDEISISYSSINQVHPCRLTLGTCSAYNQILNLEY